MFNLSTIIPGTIGDLLDETEVLEWLIQQQSSIADEDIVERYIVVSTVYNIKIKITALNSSLMHIISFHLSSFQC